jgi:hypothetical protein
VKVGKEIKMRFEEDRKEFDLCRETEVVEELLMGCWELRKYRSEKYEVLLSAVMRGTQMTAEEFDEAVAALISNGRFNSSISTWGYDHSLTAHLEYRGGADLVGFILALAAGKAHFGGFGGSPADAFYSRKAEQVAGVWRAILSVCPAAGSVYSDLAKANPLRPGDKLAAWEYQIGGDFEIEEKTIEVYRRYKKTVSPSKVPFLE